MAGKILILDIVIINLFMTLQLLTTVLLGLSFQLGRTTVNDAVATKDATCHTFCN